MSKYFISKRWQRGVCLQNRTSYQESNYISIGKRYCWKLQINWRKIHHYGN